MSQEVKITQQQTANASASAAEGLGGLSLPAIPVLQKAKFHTTAAKPDKAAKGEKKPDHHELADSTYHLVTQRKEQQTITSLSSSTGGVVDVFRPDIPATSFPLDVPIVQKMSDTGVVQRNDDDDGDGDGGWTQVGPRKGKKNTAPFDPAMPAARKAPNIPDDNAFQVMGEPTNLTDLARGLSLGRDIWGVWMEDDEIMMNILKGPFEANWFKARGCLTMGQWPDTIPKDKKPPHQNSIQFMNGMVETRWRVWKTFTDLALAKMKQEVQEAATKPQMNAVKDKLAKQGKDQGSADLAKTLDPVGSMAVTSDVDLSLGGSNTEIAVGLINREFRKHFSVPYDPGTVFDINVYASDWIHGDDGRGIQTGSTVTFTPNSEVDGMSDEGRTERDDKMEVWSLVKIRRNMSVDEWESYCKQQIDTFSPADAAGRSKMKNKLDSANLEYTIFRKKVEDKMAAMDAQLKSEEARLVFTGGKQSAFDSEFQDAARETRASNAIYAEMLLEVKEMRMRLTELQVDKIANRKAIDTLGKALSSKIAEALTYANEVYASEGAVQHTVLDQGASKRLDKLKKGGRVDLTEVKYNLRKELFLQSVNENVGDALHSLHAYHHMPHYAVYRAGKYLSRLVDAAGKLLQRPDVEAGIPFYEEIKLVGKTAMDIKSTKVIYGGQELEGDPNVVAKNGFFKGFDAPKATALTPKVIAFGAAVPALFNKLKNEARTP